MTGFRLKSGTQVDDITLVWDTYSEAFLMEDGQMTKLRVWDPLIRLVHWSLVFFFTLAMITGDDFERVHEFAGFIIAGLVAIRILWGFVGSRYARFSNFVRLPSQIVSYLRDMLKFRAKRYIGHNPAGGAMIVVLLFMLAMSAGTGWLLSVDKGGAEWIEAVHEVMSNGTLILVFAHIAGVIISGLAHGKNLVKAMINGRKRT